MFTVCAFWMMKISTTIRAATLAISPVRMLLIWVDSRRRWGAAGAAGADPLAERGGRVLVVLCGAADSVMALLLSRSGDRPMRSMAGSHSDPGQLAAVCG